MICRRWAGLRKEEIETDDFTKTKRNRPTMPILRLLLGLPSSTFFSAAAAFLGGILVFLAAKEPVTENFLAQTGTVRPVSADRDGGMQQSSLLRLS